ncbi:putative ubiquitin-conjugating enzyme/RWD [Helianthus anomalus]
MVLFVFVRFVYNPNYMVTENMLVRDSEGRMDPLRAVIIRPKGTPYHDGIFFFVP